MSIFVNMISILACFLFGAGQAAAMAQAFHEKKWNEFGASFMLTACFVIGIALILQIWIFK